MEDEIDIKDLFFALWRKKILIIVITCVFLVIGIFLNINSEKKDEKAVISNENSDLLYVETDFMLSSTIQKDRNENNSSHNLKIDSEIVANLNKFAKSDTLLNNIISEINFNKAIDVETLKNNIYIYGDENSSMLTLIVLNDDEEKAAEISNKIIVELSEKTNQIYDIREIVIIDGPKQLDKKDIELLKEKISNVNIDEKTDNVWTKKKVVLLTVVGFVLACGVVVIIEIFDDTVKNENELEKNTNLKTLVNISKSNSDLDSKFDILRVNLNDNKIILVTSSDKNVGKSFVAENLAKSYAKNGKKTLLTNLESLFSIEDERKENSENLTIVLNNRKDIAEFDEKNIESIINKLSEKYEIIIIDGDNVLESANTLTILKFVKNAILVVSERQTKLENAIKAKKIIENLNCNVIGSVLNNSRK